ncbi:MAG: cbb3-type cytochrome c oxidase subunit I [Streptosporangiaceae bacterium]|nr:cbb3-type cytochrome c oxidase subunit I [Streptosporangiaceae bacterium]
MTAEVKAAVYPPPAEDEGRDGLLGWLLTIDHKRIGLLTIGTALLLFFFNGAIALTMRAQLAQPNQDILSPQAYLQFMTMHGTGMIATTITPLALGLGVYLVPLQIGAPRIAAPRTTLLGYWFYVAGAIMLIWGFLTPQGAQSGWWGYTPLSNSMYTPGPGQPLWVAGFFLAATGMILQGVTTLWTILRLRAPGVTMMRMPVFTWAQLVTVLMVVAAFPALLAALLIIVIQRFDPGLGASNAWNFAYQELFWFYGHPVVYVMFFPFVGCVAEALSTFSGRRFFGYQGTVLSLLVFATGSMAVWGHHLFASGQEVNDYFSLTSIMLTIPAGVEYFGFLGTILGGRLRYTTSMLFALAFIPQFLIGGLTGILVANPTIDYQVNNSYFILGHFHYTLLAGSFFGFMAGFYLWFPKATGVMLREGLGKLHLVLLVIGTNTTFIPFFFLGMRGMPRWMATYPSGAGFTTLSLISSIGAGIIGLAMLVLLWNIYVSARFKKLAPPDPWRGQTLEWATSSPPPRFNFNLAYPVPKVRGYAPLFDLRERARGEQARGEQVRAQQAAEGR